MDYIQLSPIEQAPQPKKPWYLSHKFLNIVLGVLLLLLVGEVWYYYKIEREEFNSLSYSHYALVSRSGQSDVLSDWKTYTNEQYGFEFKYPGHWVLSGQLKEESELDLIPPEQNQENGFGEYAGNIVRVNLDLLKDKESIDDWIKNNTALDLKISKKGTISGYSSLEFTYEDELGGEKFRDIIVQKNNLLLHLSATVENQYFDQILSTFKFIEPVK